MEKVLDVMGQVCPFPLEKAKAAVNEIDSGDKLIINFDCTQATDSIPRWAAETGLAITNFEQTSDAAWTITLKKS